MVKLVLKTADWDDSAGTHNALATESAFLTAQIVAEFDIPAKATVTLMDPTGAIFQKYDVDPAGDSVYIGPGRAYIYDDDDVGDACLFDGRIVRSVPDRQNHRLTLECEDWLSQLDERRVSYDMREELNAAHLRQSEVHSDADNGTFVGPVYATYAALAGAVAIDGAVESDDTTDANDADANDMELLPAVPVANDAYCYGFDRQVEGIRINVGTAATAAGADNPVITWQYSQGSDVWADLAGVVDGTNSYLISGSHTVTYTMPTDWATDEVGGIAGKYWIKAKLTHEPAGGFMQIPIGTQAGGIASTIFDDDMSWVADTYNGKYMILTGGMAGTITVDTGPYGGACSAGEGAGDFQALSYDNTWVDDANAYVVWDNDEDWTSDFYFRVYVGHNTPSDFYVHDSITGAKIVLSYSFRDSVPDATCDLQVYDNTGAAWVSIADLPTYDNARGTIIRRQTFDIPTQYVSSFVNSSGIAKVRFNVTYGTGTAYLYVYYLRAKVDVATTGYSTALYIYDTGTNYLQVDKDMSVTTTQIWEGVPYCIAQPIHKHIKNDGATYLGTLVTGGDVIYAMTANANIEATTGISTRHYIDRTLLEMLQDLAGQDNAVFWAPLGGVDVKWKSTFNNGAPTAITDANVLMWKADWNYESMFNELRVYGARIGQYQIEQTSSDATSFATYGIYKTKVIKNTGVLSDHDCASIASRLLARDKDVKLYLEAVLPGLSSLRLGDELDVSSTILGLTNENYTITHWAFDYSNFRTNIRLHPRSSTVGYQENVTLTRARDIMATQKTNQQDKYVPDLYTQEWS